MSGRTGLYFAWRMLDRYRNRENINERQIEFALKAIESVTGRTPIPGSPTYAFSDEEMLRGKVAAR